MRIDVVTLFPEMVRSVGAYGVTGRAVQRGLLALRCWNPREFTDDAHRTVDDRPYGGGPGMVMKYAPLRDALSAARQSGAEGPVVYLSPQGRRLDQAALGGFARRGALLLIAGRYEGVDERFIEAEVDEEWSIGDYVLSGGELAAMVVVDALARLIPRALGDADSAQQDSFFAGLLDCPHYTRPEVVDGREVPAVLRTGDHAAIARWRRREALGRTWLRRPDLLRELRLNREDRALLAEFQNEIDGAGGGGPRGRNLE